MKKIILATCLLLALLCTQLTAFAQTSADAYLVDRVWEMSITGYANKDYMFFHNSGRGFMARNYSTSSARCYYFTWYTYSENGMDYIRVDFNDGAPVNGWSTLNNPHQRSRYTLLWNPDFMYLMDTMHSGTDPKGRSAQKTIELTNPQTPSNVLLERYAQEIRSQFN